MLATNIKKWQQSLIYKKQQKDYSSTELPAIAFETCLDDLERAFRFNNTIKLAWFRNGNVLKNNKMFEGGVNECLNYPPCSCKMTFKIRGRYSHDTLLQRVLHFYLCFIVILIFLPLSLFNSAFICLDLSSLLARMTATPTSAILYYTRYSHYFYQVKYISLE